MCVCIVDASTHIFPFFHYVFNVVSRWFFPSHYSAIQVSNLLSIPNRLPLLYGGFFAYYFVEYVHSAVDVSMVLECLFTEPVL